MAQSQIGFDRAIARDLTARILHTAAYRQSLGFAPQPSDRERWMDYDGPLIDLVRKEAGRFGITLLEEDENEVRSFDHRRVAA